MSEREQRHTIAVLVDNEPGVLARVIGLFSGRGYNIDSLTVAEVDHVRGLSRINIVTTGTAAVIEQIKALLEKLVPVHKVSDLTIEGRTSSASWRWSRSGATASSWCRRSGSPTSCTPAWSIARSAASCSRSPARPISWTRSST